MSEKNSEHEASSEAEEPAGPPPWVRATRADADGIDFEAPITASTSADARELSDLFFAQTRSAQAPDQSLDTPAARVFSMLGAATSMYFRPEDKNEPFAPMFIWGDGRRSAALEDFRGEPAILLADFARRAVNPVLRARLADVSRILDRKQGDLGQIAIAAYVEVVRRADAGALFFHAEDKGALTHDSRDTLRRALQISRATGWEKEEATSARQLATDLRRRAIKDRTVIAAWWFSDLDLDFSLSPAADVAAGLDELLANLPSDANFHSVVELWQLAARAHRNAGDQNNSNRCLSEAAERTVTEAEACFKKGSSTLASHWLATAIAQLHGIPGKRIAGLRFATG